MLKKEIKLQLAFLCCLLHLFYCNTDVSTYILTVHGHSHKLKNYPKLNADLDEFMKNFTKDLLTCFPGGISLNSEDISSNGNLSTIKRLLLITRNDDIEVDKEIAIHQLLQKLIKERKFISKAWSETSLTLKSADVCFHQVVQSFKTSYARDLIWHNSLPTKTAMSEPMCLNDWKLVTRECKSSTVTGAKWHKFDYSLCSNYQETVKDMEINCPDGFHQLKPNLCYSVHKSSTYDEANEICQNSSSFLMNSKILSDYIFSAPGLSVRMKAKHHFNRGHDETNNFCYNNSTFERNSKKYLKNMFSKIELPGKFWISEKSAYLNVHYTGKSVLLNILKLPYMNGIKSSFHCASVTWTRYSFNISVENCRRKNSFVCIYQPLKMLRSTKLSRSWSRLSTQSVCYNFASERVTWSNANHTCQSFDSKARLLQSIRDLNDYALFKSFVRTFVTDTDKEQSWWMGLVQEKDSIKWLSWPTQSVQFVDWNSLTDFSRERSAGALTFDKDNGEMRWILKDPSSKTRFICEIQDCTDSRPTLAYIEDRSVDRAMPKSYSAALNDFKLHCVTSGWYVANSISWFKDGIPISSNTDFNIFGFLVKPEATNLEDILQFQGYYWCSINQAQSFTPVLSSKILFRFPGLYTFVLYMHSSDLFVEVVECSDYMNNFILPPEFVDHLNQTIHGFEIAVLRNLTCERFSIHYYIHILVWKNMELEKKVLKSVETSVISSIETINTLLEDLQIDKNDVLVRSTVACQEEKIVFHDYITTWPTTLVGQSAQSNELCVGDNGKVIERKCLGDFNTGAFWDPILEECANVSSYTTVTLYKLSKVNITKDNILKTSSIMESLTSSSENLTSADVQYIAQILRNMATVPVIQPKVFSSAINTLDNIISVNLSRIIDNSNSNVSSKILFAVESMLPHLETNGQLFKAAGNNIAVSIFPHRDNMTRIQTGGILNKWNSNVTTIFNGTDGNDLYSAFDAFEAGVLLPEKLVSELQNEFREDFAIAIHKNIHHVKNIEVVSPVIGVSIGSRHVYDVDPPIKMTFKVPQVEKTRSYLCVFWDQNLNDNFGGWSYKGCISHYLDSSHVLCSCDHLTSFAVILEHGPRSKVSDIHQITLSFITYIGCALSIFGLGIVILTFVLFREWREDLKHKALFNLSLSLFSFMVIFVVGLENKWGSVYGCMVIAALLHYFMLASFAWMVVEAFIQYLRLVKVIGTYIPRFTQKAVLFGWGGPLLIVGTVLSIDYNLYYREPQYCWVSEEAFYYAVAGPVLAMLAMNFTIFAIIVYFNTCGRTEKYLRTNQEERKEMITRAKAVFSVSILLGLSWIFGFLAVGEAKVMFQYLFSVTTTLQGFVIFVFFVCRPKNTRDLWLSLIPSTITLELFNTGSTDVASKTVKIRREQKQLNKVGFQAQLSHVSVFRG